MLDSGGRQGHETPSSLIHSLGHLPHTTVWTPTSPKLNIAHLLLVDPGPRRLHRVGVFLAPTLNLPQDPRFRTSRTIILPSLVRRPGGGIQHGDTRNPIDYRQPNNLRHTHIGRFSGPSTRRSVSKNGVYCSSSVNKAVVQRPWSPSIVTSPRLLELAQQLPAHVRSYYLSTLKIHIQQAPRRR